MFFRSAGRAILAVTTPAVYIAWLEPSHRARGFTATHPALDARLKRLFATSPPIPPKSIYHATADESEPPLHNTILMIPGVFSSAECSLLIDETDKLLCENYRKDTYGDESVSPSTRRVSVCDMSTKARNLSHAVLKERVLPALEHQHPELLRRLLLANWRDFGFDWASDEPTVNKYIVGGEFEPHEDGYLLTVIILLSPEDSFEGGGTSFFSTSDAENADKVVVRPPRGMAVCFNGDVTHGGSPVTSGTRYLYVASFDLSSSKEEGPGMNGNPR